MLPDGPTIVARVLRRTDEDLARAERERAARQRGPWIRRERQIRYAAIFAKHFGQFIAEALEPSFPGMQSGETPSQSVFGIRRVDVNYSTLEAGLGFAISLKSVHFGERDEGRSHFTHNMKRNDEELRVEATAHHLRQPYAVMVAVLLMPFESCADRTRTSSFGAWVQHLWALKGRAEPDDPPDRYELVFVALYERDGSALGFYEVGGTVACPRQGRPSTLLTFGEFLGKIRTTYYERNGKDFAFQGEGPPG